MITIPIAVNNGRFKWQAELAWWSHRKVYGSEAWERFRLVVIDKNQRDDTPLDKGWYASIPHAEATGIWENPHDRIALPLNIQVGLRQLLGHFSDGAVLEVVDCDLFHFRPAPAIAVADNELHVCALYEPWHLKSHSANRTVVEPYFRHGGIGYNGGFVPIIGKASTFRDLLADWESIHRDILGRPVADRIKWWAGMFALQAACERNRITMVARDECHIPPINRIQPYHYIGHYSVDALFRKRTFPAVRLGQAPSNAYYDHLREWISGREGGPFPFLSP